MTEIVSIIIPAHNEEKDIGECLNNLNNQTFKNFEIIVVDDGSTDKTCEIVKKFKKVVLIKGLHKGPGASRNMGAKNAKGNILVFIDSDMTFDKDYIKNLIAPILNDKTGKIIGTTHDYEIAGNTKNIWSRCWGKIRLDFRGNPNWKENLLGGSPFRAIRKDKFLELGGFDSRYGYADDQTLWIKYKIMPELAKNTKCYHKNPETLKAVYKQSQWIGASKDNKFLNIPLTEKVIPLFMIIASPLMILLLSAKRILKIKEIKLVFPMLIFITVRYFGTIAGVFRRVYLKRNVR